MSNEIIVRENEINWLEVIDMAFKKQDWGKKYTLYTAGIVTVNCEMSYFDFKRQRAVFLITVEYPEDTLYYRWQNESSVDYFLNNYEIEDFKNLIKRKVVSLLNDIVKARTKRQGENIYSDKKYYSWKIDDEIIESLGLLKDYNSILKINNEELRTNMIAQFNSEVTELANKEYYKLVAEYCNTHSETIEGFDKIIEKAK